MAQSFQLLEQVTLSNKLSANFACQTSDDGRISIITETGVLIFTLRNHLDSTFTNVAFRKDFIKIPDYAFSSELDVDFESFYSELPRSELYEAALRLDISGKLNFSTPIEIKPCLASWSPKGIYERTQAVLAVLSNLFGLFIFARVLNDCELEEYECIANVTNQITNFNRIGWHKVRHLHVNTQFHELKLRTETTCPTAFTWSHVFTKAESQFCILFVGHPNGSVSAWRLAGRKVTDNEDSILKYVGTTETKLKQISTMHWYQTKRTAGGLSIGDIKGNVSTLSVSNLTQDYASFTDEVSFWDDDDNVKVENITVITYEDVTYMIIVKQSFLLIFAIDETGTVFDKMVYDIGNLYITGINHYNSNIVMVLTLTGVFKKVFLRVEDCKLSVEEEIVPLKIDLNKFRTHGFVFSENKVYLGVLAFPCRLKNIVRDKLPTNFFLFHNTSLNPFSMLMNNSSGSLASYWDCLEVLRLICFREKRFPWEGFTGNENYDDFSLLQLKTLRWAAKLSEKVYTVVQYINMYNMKPYVLLNYLVDIKLALGRIKKLLNLHNSGRKLSIFQMRSIDIQNFFLKEMVMKRILEKGNVGEKFVDEMIDVISKANELEYPPMPPCFWCGQKLIGPSCIPPHAESRCSISMMPILFIPGYKCPLCKCVAHNEISKEMDIITCPYCDIPMDQRYFSEKIKKNLCQTPDELKDNMKLALSTEIPETADSQCYDDCLHEEIDFSDIEENTADYATLSDSEDENVKRHLQSAIRDQFNLSLKTNKSQVSFETVNGESSGRTIPDDGLNMSKGDSDNSDESFDDDNVLNDGSANLGMKTEVLKP